MEIRRVKITAFKSLYELEAELQPLSVVTGPNGSGKSNLVDALTFLGDVYKHGLEYAVSRAGGYENIAHRRTRRAKRPISFEVDVHISGDELAEESARGLVWRGTSGSEWPTGESLLVRHRFGFQASSQKLLADFELVEESATLFDDSGRLLAHVVRESSSEEYAVVTQRSPTIRKSAIASLIRPFGDRGFTSESWARPLGNVELFISNWRYVNVFGSVASHLSRITMFQLSPHLSRTSGVATPNAELGRHGENLPGAAYYLRRRTPEAWKAVESSMRAIMPGLQSIDVVPTEDRRLALQFREVGIGRPWNSSEVSDGTIQTLALLIALFDSRASMLIIEEPENAVHPWILRHVVNLARDTPRQILFTTHSPVLLDYVSPEIVWLIWMKDGRSQMRRFIALDTDFVQSLTDGSLSIFDLYDSGHFSESVPRGLTSDLNEVSE